MKENMRYRSFYIFSVLGTLIASFYPLYMGIKVISDMVRNGVVYSGDYPKYIIPYTPISISIIIGVLLMPFAADSAKRFAAVLANALSLAVFFCAELLLESQVIVSTASAEAALEDWQMYMCVSFPADYVTKTETDILMGEYSPAFKIHFYLISVVLILSVLNCFYGFAKMIKSGDRRRRKALILQSATAAVFLALCILACFTAFFRDGAITVSAVSAVLMTLFFAVFGICVGIYAGSFLLGKGKLISVLLPAVVSSAAVIAMYVGEMILLGGQLFRFGAGFFFEGLGSFPLAPVDLVIILASGVLCSVILSFINNSK